MVGLGRRRTHDRALVLHEHVCRRQLGDVVVDAHADHHEGQDDSERDELTIAPQGGGSGSLSATVHVHKQKDKKEAGSQKNKKRKVEEDKDNGKEEDGENKESELV